MFTSKFPLCRTVRCASRVNLDLDVDLDLDLDSAPIKQACAPEAKLVFKTDSRDSSRSACNEEVMV
jgi:hypothetical protein